MSLYSITLPLVSLFCIPLQRPAPPHTPLVEALLAHVSEDPVSALVVEWCVRVCVHACVRVCVCGVMWCVHSVGWDGVSVCGEV